jgi:prepilin-type N-terminal cleavage/methylation domain-containing protein
MRNPVSRNAQHATRFAFHVSRITHQALRMARSALRASPAFTLIELLVVISVISLLAALTFPAASAARISIIRTRARAELGQIQSAIESYSQKLGYYPPDNSANWAFNQLYYELLGTTNVGTVLAPTYMTLNGSARISAAALPLTFGPNVVGIQNCARGGAGDEVPSAASFLNNLKSGQFLATTNGVSTTPVCTVLGSSLDGPQVFQNASGAKINPWRYNASSPRYNPKSFDLWIDVTAGAKTNRISNWSDRPLVVSAPYL